MDGGEGLADKPRDIVFSRDRAVIVALLTTGTTLRAAWAFLKPPSGRLGEAFNVATSLATGSGFANALGPHAGPTAHLTPAMVLIAGAIYRLFGVHSSVSEVLLAAISIGISLGVFVLTYRLFGLLGVARRWRLAGLACLVLVPIFWTVEAVDFRYWEGGIATTLLLVLLTRLTDHHGASVSIGEWFIVSCIVGALMVVSPTVGACGILSCAMFVLGNEPRRRWLIHGVLTLLVIAAAMLPWTIRNDLAMGRPIPSRDNLGLEMSVAYYPGAADGQMSNERYWKRVLEIQPYNSPEAYQKMQAAGGELKYYDQLKRSVFAWIAANPRQAFVLTIRHIREFVLPPSWVFHMESARRMEMFRYYVFMMICILGYSSAAFCFVRCPKTRYAAVATLALPCAYMIVDPMPRYFWPNYALLTFWSVTSMWKTSTYFSSRRG